MSLRVGASAHCRELYSEAVFLPRVLLLALSLALLTAVALLVRRRQRRLRQYAPLSTQEDASPKPSDADHDVQQPQGLLQRRLRVAIVVGFVWTAIWFLSFQAYDFMTADSSGPGRPRMVFSFTTTSSSINEIKPTLDALLGQSGEGFDTIYVIVPREYKGEPVAVPQWLVGPTSATNRSDFYGWKYTLAASVYHPKVHVLIIDKDFGPGSKVLGTLMVEQEPETIIVYGDDDRAYPKELAARALYYTMKFPRDAVAVLGGWISAEDSLYCGRSLEIGINRVSFVGGAGGVVVRRKFYAKGFATTAAFAVTELSKACFLGDDYYLSLVLSRNHVRRRVVYDSCWSIDTCKQSIGRWGLSGGKSSHPGGANVEHYQQCIRELGYENDLSVDAEFGQLFMVLFSRTWGVFRLLFNLLRGREVVAC